MPKVSVVIPVYNGSNYLAKAIDSALAQTYENIEIIVVNDGSKDDGKSERIALSYGDKIRYFSKENGGSSSALNCGIRMMEGEYFSWLSHDDLYYPDKIKEEIAYADENSVVFSGADLIDANGEIIKKATGLKEARDYIESHSNEHFIAQPSRYYFSGCTCLIPKKVFEEVGLFNEKLRLVNDYDLWFRIYKNGYRIRFVDQPLVMSRMHASQISRNTVFLHNTEEELMFWNETLCYLKENYPDNKELFELFAECAYHQTIDEIGDKAMDYIGKKGSIKSIALKVKAKVWMLMKKVYLKLWIDRK